MTGLDHEFQELYSFGSISPSSLKVCTLNGLRFATTLFRNATLYEVYGTRSRDLLLTSSSKQATRMDYQTKPQFSLTVSRRSVKTIKNALEAHDLLDRSIKISPVANGESFSIPLKGIAGIDLLSRNELRDTFLSHFLSSIGKEICENDVTLCLSEPLGCAKYTEDSVPAPLLSHTPAVKGRNNPFDVTLEAWLKSIPTSVPLQSADGELQWPLGVGSDPSAFQNSSGYTVYPPMLLLPAAALSSYLEDDKYFNHLARLYENLSCTFKVTHIALGAPIPVSHLNKKPSGSKSEECLVASPNVLRSPTGLKPLYGDFGPNLPVGHKAIPFDYESAFWCIARQNTILQTWAPRYTMFSNGNISEKTRILNLAHSGSSLGSENTHTGYRAEQSTAIDLYAGIGYFAFSYAKAGVSKILCWEINPWSVEGLQRGARMNRWPVMTIQRHEDDDLMTRKAVEEESRIFVFEESNAYAMARINVIRERLPKIRHVNCGFLPSSKASWKTAVAALDPEDGGWIHAHENIAKKDIETRKHEVVSIFRDLVTEVYGHDNIKQRIVSCEYLERVKSYAPGVIHCVLDIAVSCVSSE